MEQKFFHGNVDHRTVARSLAARFSRGNLQAKVFSEPNRSVFQLATRARPAAGGRTAMNVILQQHEEGLAISVGQQNYLGLAASLGASAISVLRNPLNILGRIDDIAQDVEYLQLTEEVYRAIEAEMRLSKATTGISERLRRDICPYCTTPNIPGEASCVACGAPLAELIPYTCLNCGYILRKTDEVCPNCRKAIS